MLSLFLWGDYGNQNGYLYFIAVDDLKKYIRKRFLATAEEADV